MVQNAFNNFFINIGPKLADDIPTGTRSFESYVEKSNETIKNEPITIDELKDAFFPLKIDKISGYDEISFNVIKNCFRELCDPLKIGLSPSQKNFFLFASMKSSFLFQDI